MPLIDVSVGQLVYIIENNEIIEAYITRFLNQKEVVVTSKRLDDYSKGFYPQQLKTYGIDFFFTREKAKKVLPIYLEKRVRKQLAEIETSELDIRTIDKLQEVDNHICGSCGLPIGTFGHCGCSY
jgi:hypothetical protein